MKRFILILGTAWLLTLGAAFLIGQGARHPESQENAQSEQRSLSRTSSSSSWRRGTKGARDWRSSFRSTGKS